MDRLLDLTGLPHQDMFRSKAELLAQAMATQEEKIAFVDEKMLAETLGATR
jgi:hypothetical protein